MKAVLPGDDLVSDEILDMFSIVPSSSKIQTLTVPYETCDKSETVKSAERDVRRPTPFSTEWVVKQVHEDDRTDRIGMHLRQWMNEKRHPEIDEELINHLKGLTKEQLTEAVAELRKPKKFIRGTRGNQLSVPIIIQTEDMVTQFAVTGLIDSGCTGSCIDIGLVQ